MSVLITPEMVNLSMDATSKEDAIAEMVQLLVAAGRVSDGAQLLQDVLLRETQMQTGIEGGIGIPHARSAAVNEPSLAFAKSPRGVDFGSSDGPADLIFLIAVPSGSDADHMKIIASLARRLIHASFKDGLRQAKTAQDVADLITKEVLG